MENQTKQQTILEYDLPIKINLGDVFYSIEQIGQQYFYEPCKVCEGKGKLTVNGVTFRCPCCNEYRSPFSIYQYKVTRWRVYEITQETGNGYWKADTRRNLIVKLYTTTGRGYGNANCRKLTEFCFKNCLNLDFEKVLKEVQSYYDRLDECIFDNYSLACKVADKLNAYEVAKVEQHNKESGTQYPIPIKPKYDPKSN